MKKPRAKTPPSAEGTPPARPARRHSIPAWLAVMFITWVWMFVLGLLVGRGTAPVRFDIANLQKELAALKEAMYQKEMTRFKIDTGETISKTGLGFYEALKKERDESLLPVVKRMAPKPAPPPKAPPAQAAVKPPPKKKRADSSRGDRPKPSKAPPAVRQAFTIQVGAFRSKGDAQTLMGKLKKQGYSAYLTRDKVPGKGIWFRVRVGSFKTRAKAGGTLARLKRQKLTGFVVSR